LGARLVAKKKYLVQPAYWEISVEWDEAGAIYQALSPYHVSLPLDGILGSKGIEVVGLRKSEKINVP
jgi:hypothetical protein